MDNVQKHNICAYHVMSNYCFLSPITVQLLHVSTGIITDLIRIHNVIMERSNCLIFITF
jgi:hypothetical protein